MPISDNIIGKIDKDTKIYRIFPRTYFLQLFQENRNALVLPTKWKDPFENVFLKADVVVSATGEKGKFEFHDDVYGQCWTLETASDAMWQIYSREKDSVRVRTTVGKLFASLCDRHNDWAHVSCYIGRVEYLTETDLKEFGRTVFKSFPPSEAVARSLLVKRRAYKHENEVRIIYFQPSDTKYTNGVYSYSLEPRSIIDQVMVDGRVAYSDFLPFKKQVMELTGLSASQVKLSLLYRQPKGFVVEVGEID
jgi:hypothetical protein